MRIQATFYFLMMVLFFPSCILSWLIEALYNNHVDQRFFELMLMYTFDILFILSIAMIFDIGIAIGIISILVKLKKIDGW